MLIVIKHLEFGTMFKAQQQSNDAGTFQQDELALRLADSVNCPTWELFAEVVDLDQGEVKREIYFN